ncbi:MAG: amino acid permease [Gammaproteobacteria bacterium]|nr:amino acid permease [Gammaproteobacteria bacterium]
MSLTKMLFRTKPISPSLKDVNLKRCLTGFDLAMLGVGAIIGAGIFVLTGVVAATQAGPAIIFSYVVAGCACAFSAFAYAELASSIGGCGSAYGYSFAGLGELIAWIIGWDLLLEYSLVASTVAIGWSGYVNNALTAMGLPLPESLTVNPFEGGIVDLPAVLIVAFISILLIIGVKESVKVNRILVFVKLTAIAIFIGIAIFHFNPAQNWRPFLPFGWEGVMGGAAIMFFAYIGFDAVSTAAEEAVNPQRDLPKGIIYSLVICTLLYMVVAGLLTGIMPYTQLNVSSPIAYSLLTLGYKFGGAVVSIGAIFGLTTVVLVFCYGLTRIFLAMSRDGLLPPVLAQVNKKRQTPVRIIVFSGVVIAIIAGFTPINEVASLANIGTLAAFTVVCLGVIILRYTKPDMPRPFKTPFSPLIPILGVLFCLYLMSNLSALAWQAFAIWTIVGLIIYFSYGRHNSILAKKNT